MENITCPHVWRGDGCLKAASESACPMLAIGCTGCVKTDFLRLIPVQGRTSQERDAFRAQMSMFADS